MTEYCTIVKEAEAEFIEKRSRFIGAIAPVTTPEAAADFVASRREKHYYARHTVFAYLLKEGGVCRCSDDGEPQGTGGMPVLEVIRRSGVVDICVAVTRYFGGVLLGAGPLTRAYANGAAIAVAAAERVTVCLCTDCLIETDYSRYEMILRLLPRCGAVVIESDFGAKVRLAVRLKTGAFDTLQELLRESTGATVTAKLIGESFAPLTNGALSSGQ